MRLARLFTLGIGVAVYLLSLTWGDSLFDISRKAFEGYTTLVPTLLLGVQWRRFTAAGAIASIVAANGVLWASWSFGGLGFLGFLPVFWAFVAGLLAGVGVSLGRPSRASL